MAQKVASQENRFNLTVAVRALWARSNNAYALWRMFSNPERKLRLDALAIFHGTV